MIATPVGDVTAAQFLRIGTKIRAKPNIPGRR